MAKDRQFPDELVALAEHLRTLKTIPEIDKHLERDGGIGMPNDRFMVYQREYHRRGAHMPQ